MTYTEILTQCYDRLGIRGTIATEVSRRIGGFVNEAHNEILGTKGFQRLRRRTLPFSTVASSSFAVLPQVVDKLYGIADRTNRFPLTEIDPEDVWWGDPALASTGANALSYGLMDQAFPVAKDPSDASALFVKSTAAGDTTQTAYIEGVTNGGFLRTASVVLTGTTAVNVASAISDWVTVTKFYLSATCTGEISLYEDSGAGTLLATIGISKTSTKYSRVQFWPTPSTAQTLYADVDLAILDMSNSTDEPLLPYKFHWLLVTGALKREYEHREKLELFSIQEGRWNKGMGALRSFINRRQGKGQPFVRRGPMVPLLPGEIAS